MRRHTLNTSSSLAFQFDPRAGTMKTVRDQADVAMFLGRSCKIEFYVRS